MLTDSRGTPVSFRSCMVVFTATTAAASNAATAAPGSSAATAAAPVPSAGIPVASPPGLADAATRAGSDSSGAASGGSAGGVPARMPPAAAHLASRVDATAALLPLQPPQMHALVDRELQRASESLERVGTALKVDADARRWLASAGCSTVAGARPLARLVQQQVIAPALDAALAGGAPPSLATTWQSAEAASERSQRTDGFTGGHVVVVTQRGGKLYATLSDPSSVS